MAGDKIKMAPGAIMMIHGAQGITIGGSRPHRASLAAIDTMNQATGRIFAKRGKLQLAEMLKLMDEELWLDGPEAVRRGFADESEHAINASEPPALSQVYPVFDYRTFKHAPPELKSLAEGWAAAGVQMVGLYTGTDSDVSLRSPEVEDLPPSNAHLTQSASVPMTKTPEQIQAEQDAAVRKAISDTTQSAAKTERERIAAIVGSEEAKGRGELAQHLAYATEMSPSDAKALLAKAPKASETAPAGGGQGEDALTRAMRQLGNPQVGADGRSPDTVTEQLSTAAKDVEMFAKLKGWGNFEATRRH
jgi:hypothetical protein